MHTQAADFKVTFPFVFFSIHHVAWIERFDRFSSTVLHAGHTASAFQSRNIYALYVSFCSLKEHGMFDAPLDFQKPREHLYRPPPVTITQQKHP